MGLTHLDAGVLIGFFNANDAHHAAACSVLQDGIAGEQFAMSASSLAESLITPARQGEGGIRAAMAAIGRLSVRTVDLTAEIAIETARLRAAHRSLRLPDALVIATAIESGADRLVTTDRRWPPLDSDLRVERI